MLTTVNEYRWQDLKLGLKHEFQVTVTRQMMEHFLQDTGDCSPLHVDTAFAKNSGFNERVVYGLLTSSFYSTLAGVYLPGKYCFLYGVDVSFLKPAFIDDRLTVSGEINYMNDEFMLAHIKAQIVNATGEKISRAKIKFGILSTGQGEIK
jgi:3-hydroxybutyryl-CoA dehydratase